MDRAVRDGIGTQGQGVAGVPLTVKHKNPIETHRPDRQAPLPCPTSARLGLLYGNNRLGVPAVAQGGWRRPATEGLYRQPSLHRAAAHSISLSSPTVALPFCLHQRLCWQGHAKYSAGTREEVATYRCAGGGNRAWPVSKRKRLHRRFIQIGGPGFTVQEIDHAVPSNDENTGCFGRGTY